MLHAISSAQQGLQTSELQADRAVAQISAWPYAGQFAATGASSPSTVDAVDLSSAAISLSQATDAHTADINMLHVVDNMQKQTSTQISVLTVTDLTF